MQDNPTGRPVNRFWSGGDPFTSTYVNNRQQGIQHDNDGRVTYDQSQRSHTYDAAGRKIRTQETSKSSSWGLVLSPQQASSPNSLEREQERPNMPEGGYYTTTTLTLQAAYDAQGRSTKRVQTKIQSTPFYQPVTSILTEYYVRSSVLGGKVITELNDAGEKHKTKVYAGKDVVAEQKLYTENHQGIIWEHRNPITSTEIEQSASNGVTTKREYDPWGLELGEADPYLMSAQPDYASLPGASSYRLGGNPFGRGDACQWNGMPFNCGMLGFVLRTQNVDRIDVHMQGQEGGGFGMQLGLSRRWMDGTDGVTGGTIDEDGIEDWGNERLTPYRGFVWEFVASGFFLSSVPLKIESPQDTTARGQRLSDEDCAKKLAELFGGPGAVVSLGHEPSTLQHPIAGKNRGDDGHSATPRNDMVNTNDRGGIIHIYGNAQGTATNTGLYVPSGFRQITSVRGENGSLVQLKPGPNNQRYFINDALGVTAVFAHVATRGVRVGDRNVQGSTRIGNIGGPGGRSSGYTHTHIAFYSQYFGHPYTGTRVDPRGIFCK